MYPTQSIAPTQQRTRAYCQSYTTFDFFNLLTSDELLDKVEELLPEHRERLYPPTETLSMFLAQALSPDRSCQQVVNHAATQRALGGMRSISTRTGGYCRARQRLPEEMPRQLTYEVGQLIERNVPSDWRWRRRRVCIVDGTTLSMPDTSANQATYPQLRGQKAGLGFPICRLLAVTCLSSGALINAAIGAYRGKGADERTLLRQLQGEFKAGDIILADGLFSSYFFLAEQQARGIDVLLEKGTNRRLTDFRTGKRLGGRDHIVRLDKPKSCPAWMTEEQYLAAPSSIEIREFKAAGKVMVTTLICPQDYPKAALKELYRSRWNVELDLRSIKDVLGMGILSCKTPEMVHKEIWVYLLAYNLVRFSMTKSALLADLMPRYLSFKHTLQLWLTMLPLTFSMTDEQYTLILYLAAENTVGHRPGRIEPRAVKRRPKPYALLTLPRGQAQKEIKRYGHPKKVK